MDSSYMMTIMILIYEDDKEDGGLLTSTVY